MLRGWGAVLDETRRVGITLFQKCTSKFYSTDSVDLCTCSLRFGRPHTNPVLVTLCNQSSIVIDVSCSLNKPLAQRYSFRKKHHFRWTLSKGSYKLMFHVSTTILQSAVKWCWYDLKA